MDHNRGGGIVKFIRLHRRSIVIGGVAGVVISGILRARRAYHDAMDMVLDAETQAAERRKAEQETRRKECCLERTSKECDVAFLRFITSLDDAIDNKIFSHLPSMISRIKDIRGRRVEGASGSSSEHEKELWEQLKVATFSKLMVGMYGFVLVNLVLRVQLHIIGRVDANSQQRIISNDARAKFLTLTYNFILGEGLHKLSEVVTPIADAILSEVSMGVKVDFASVENYLCSIRRECELSNMLQFVVCPSEELKESCPDGQAMLDETWDIVESPQFELILTQAFDASFRLLLDQIRVSLFEKPGSPNTLAVKPLPTLLVQMKPKKTIFLVQDERSMHAAEISKLKDVQLLCNAVFSSTGPEQ